jgi:C_GCAxxG_C_C family probable redox protein
MGTTGDRQRLLARIEEDFQGGWHCAEVIFARLGRHRDPAFDPGLVRLAGGFAGGMVAGTEACGALSGGILLLGYLYGRRHTGEDEDRCRELVGRFVRRFRSELGGTTCHHFTGGERDPAIHRRCTALVVRAAEILLDVLPGYGGPQHPTPAPSGS